MEIAQWELHDVSFVEEAFYGETPASPSMKSFWHNSISLEPKRDTLRSERRLGNRGRPLSRLGFKRCEGSAEVELCYSNFDEFLEALLMGRFPTAFTQISDTCSIVAATGVVTDDDSGSAFANVEVGDWVTMAGWVNAGNNGTFQVTAKPDDDNITFANDVASFTNESAVATTFDQQERLEDRSEWEIPFTTLTGITYSAANADNSFNDSGSGFGDIEVGDWIAVKGFTTAANNGIFQVVTAAAGKITVSGGTLQDEAAGDTVTIDQKIYRSFTFEGRYQDISAFHQFPGVMIKSGAFTLNPDNIVMVNFGLLGANFVPDTTQLGAPAAQGDYEPFDCLGGTYTEGGTATTRMTAFDCTVENNNNIPKALGQTVSTEQTLGAFETTGSVSFYLTDNTLISKFWNETITSLEVTLQDPDGNDYIIGFPYVKIMDVDLKKSGDIEAVVGFSFEAGEHPTTGCQIYIIR
jgi:hypothetical protein